MQSQNGSGNAKEDLSTSSQASPSKNNRISSSIDNSLSSPNLNSTDEFDFPLLHELFQEYDLSFFDGLLGAVEVRWSSRMTLCAGLCLYQKGGYCSVRLSAPLLKYRTVKEFKETLLHEMIHALLFITHNNKDRESHGPLFCSHMRRINNVTGFNITIYHNFKDEVNYYRKHIWRCSGSCRDRPPFFGFVKRSMNRAPSKNDFWWHRHASECGGEFTKCSSPQTQQKASIKIDKRATSRVPKDKLMTTLGDCSRSSVTVPKHQLMTTLGERSNVTTKVPSRIKNSAVISGGIASRTASHDIHFRQPVCSVKANQIVNISSDDEAPIVEIKSSPSQCRVTIPTKPCSPSSSITSICPRNNISDAIVKTTSDILKQKSCPLCHLYKTTVELDLKRHIQCCVRDRKRC